MIRRWMFAKRHKKRCSGTRACVGHAFVTGPPRLADNANADDGPILPKGQKLPHPKPLLILPHGRPRKDSLPYGQPKP